MTVQGPPAQIRRDSRGNGCISSRPFQHATIPTGEVQRTGRRLSRTFGQSATLFTVQSAASPRRSIVEGNGHTLRAAPLVMIYLSIIDPLRVPGLDVHHDPSSFCGRVVNPKGLPSLL